MGLAGEFIRDKFNTASYEDSAGGLQKEVIRLNISGRSKKSGSTSRKPGSLYFEKQLIY